MKQLYIYIEVTEAYCVGLWDVEKEENKKQPLEGYKDGRKFRKAVFIS